MFEYKKAKIRILDIEPIDIIDEMNDFGRDGWEVISISEKIETRPCYGGIKKTTVYTLYMKRKVVSNDTNACCSE